MFANWIFIAGLGIFILLFIAVGCVQSLVKKRLRAIYITDRNVPHETFNPFDHSANGTVSFLKFIVRKRYSVLNDDKLTRGCNALRVLYICYLLTFFWMCFSVIMKQP